MTAGRRRLPAGPGVVGILNVTPDSFSDGGLFVDPARAVEHGLRLLEEGACALDLGAESTRPGATEVEPAEQLRRLLPVLAALRRRCDVPLSVDTRHALVARGALDAGADVINDVSALRHDAALAGIVAAEGASLILMHSRGTPADMQAAPAYRDVLAEVRDELAAALGRAREAGCPEDGLVVDPGFGFAKNAAHNLELLRRLPGLAVLGRPILAGLSRKALVGSLLAKDGAPRPVTERAAGSVGLALAAIARGAALVRVHDVRVTADALACFLAAGPPGAPNGAATCPPG